MTKTRLTLILPLSILLANAIPAFSAENSIKAKIEAGAKRVRVGQRVLFDATASHAGRGDSLIGFFWDFNDMDLVSVDAMGDTASHVFHRAGAYTVKLVVENGVGERDRAVTTIEVLPDTDQGPAITDYFQGGKTGLMVKGDETFSFRLEWGGQFFFRIDNCRNAPVSLRIYGYGKNRLVPESITPYSEDYSFDEKFTLMAAYSYGEPDWRPLAGAVYEYDPEAASLAVRFTPTEESIYLAWAAPYTMSDLEAYLDRWEDRPEFSYKTIGLSVEGRPIYQVTITDRSVNDKDKKVVWITATQHGYEMAAGPVVEGITAALFEGSDSAKTVLGSYIYQIVPIVNPDAVFRGGYRYNMHDVDLNRNWDDKQGNDWDRPLSEPEVAAVQRSLSDWVHRGGKLDLFFDFHCLTTLSDTLLMIKAAPDSMPAALLKEQDRFIRDFFAKRWVWRVSKGRGVADAAGAIANLYAGKTGVLSYTPEHTLGRIARADGRLVRNTPALMRRLGADYVWTIREYFESRSEGSR